MLRSSNNRFDQFVKRTLENADVEPSRFLWDRIEKQLPPITKWYSKYKYLLLLGILSFTSSTSILIYKTFFIKNDVSKIAFNKRLLKDEIASKNNPASGTSSATLQISPVNKTSSSNKINGSQNRASVASFYTSENNTSNNSDVFNGQREKRLKRFEVKNEATTETAASTQEQNNSATVSFTSSTASQKTPAVKNNATTLDYTDIAETTGNTKPAISSEKNNVEEFTDKTATSQNSSSNIAATEDVTQPIAEPIKRTEAEPLTASMSPVKPQTTPLPSRQVLKSLISPEKLEKLDVEKSAANNIDPKRAKMLKIKKQFNGYDINKGFHIGAFFNLNNNWLTNKYYSADENTTSIKPQMQMGKAYGLNIGYDYTDRWGIELEWQISDQGQKYIVGQMDGLHSKSVNLTYTKFPLMVKYKHTFINNFNTRPMAISFLVGPQMAFLVKQKVLMDGERVQNAPGYNKTEMGLMGGFDYDLFLTRFMVFTIGARTGFGSTLKKGQPMSFQLGMTAQFNFRFPKKN